MHGMTTIVYEGLPTKPDAGIWWKIVQDHKVRTMFSSPTAIRVLKKQDPAWLKKYDLSSLRYLFLAGEPLDETTSRWIPTASACRCWTITGRPKPAGRCSATCPASS
jgi:propionyl-CoA synthetase